MKSSLPHPPGSLRRRMYAATAASAALALTLAACGANGDDGNDDTSADGAGEGAASGEINPDATIHAGISYGLSGGFDPMSTSGAVTVAANWHTMEGLTELDPVTRELLPGLGAGLPDQVDDTTGRSPCARVRSSTTAMRSPPMTWCTASNGCWTRRTTPCTPTSSRSWTR